MEIKFDFFSLFALTAIGQGLFLLFFLIVRHYKNISYRLLLCILFVLLFEVVHDFLVETRLMLHTPHLLSTGHLFSYCIGPLIYLYVLSLTRPHFRFRPIHLLHLIPFVLYNVIRIPSYLQSSQQKLGFLHYYYNAIDTNPSHFHEASRIMDILNGFLIYDLHKIVYVILACILFFNYRRRLLNEYSNLEKTNIKWMQYILVGYSIFWLLIPLRRFHMLLSLDTVLINNLGSMLLPIHLYFIAFLAYSQPSGNELVLGKKGKRTEDIDSLKEILKNSNEVLQKEKAFLDKDITLPGLANKIGIREHDLSKAINHLLEINFFDYINKQRVEEAKKLLLRPDNQQYTVEHIGKLAGFSSKATFYRAFKKQTGRTPSAYQKSAGAKT